MSEFLKIIFRIFVRRDVILTFVGVLIGGGISHVYYVKSLNDLKADAEEKKRVDALIFQGIESIGTIKYSRDALGKVTGVAIELKGSANSSSTASGELTVGTFPNTKNK